MFVSTLRVYRAAAAAAGGAIVRGPAAWVASLLIFPLLGILGMLVAPLGIIGGFIIGFATAALLGAYLFLVGEALTRKSALGWSVLRESLGHLLWEVMGVMFFAWILQIVLGAIGAPSMVVLGLGLALLVMFNPAPEVITQDRAAGTTDTLMRSFRFMTANAPEWILPHLVLVGICYALAPILAEWWLGSGVLVHPIMLFRGALYRELATGSRRAREWRSRF